MSDLCTDLDVGKGVIEPGCGASHTTAQLHTMCCHRTFSVSTAEIHDRLALRHKRCPTDTELGSGKKALHRDDRGVWRRAGSGDPKRPGTALQGEVSGRTRSSGRLPANRVAS